MCHNKSRENEEQIIVVLISKADKISAYMYSDTFAAIICHNDELSSSLRLFTTEFFDKVLLDK